MVVSCNNTSYNRRLGLLTSAGCTLMAEQVTQNRAKSCGKSVNADTQVSPGAVIVQGATAEKKTDKTYM